MTGENIDSYIVKYAEFLDRQIEVQKGRPYREQDSIEKILGVLERHRAELSVDATPVEVSDENRPEREYIQDYLRFLDDAIAKQGKRPYDERKDIKRCIGMYTSHRETIEKAFPEVIESPIPPWAVFVKPLPARARNALERFKVTSVEKLTEYSESHLRSWPNVGNDAIESIREQLSLYDLSLAEDEPRQSYLPEFEEFIQELGNRVRNGLVRAGIDSYKALLNLTPYGVVEDITNIGGGSLAKIQAELSEYDLSLASGDVTSDIPKFEKLRNRLGNATRSALDQEGIDSYEKLIALTPNDVLGYEGIGKVNLGKIQMELTRYDLSLKSGPLENLRNNMNQ